MYISKDSLKRRCAFYSVASKFEEINQNDQIKSLDSLEIMFSIQKKFMLILQLQNIELKFVFS